MTDTDTCAFCPADSHTTLLACHPLDVTPGTDTAGQLSELPVCLDCFENAQDHGI